MNCPMCGSTIPDDLQAVCTSCPISAPSGCRSHLLRCPSCGYHTLATEEARTVEERGAGTHPNGNGAGGLTAVDIIDQEAAVRPLSRVRRGQRGRVVGFGELEPEHLRDLMAHGLVPAAPVRLLQARPAYVLELSGGDVAIGPELAESILVAVDA